MNPEISIVLSAIRTKWWKDLLKSLESNTIPYEVIFVGDVRPNFDLPSNAKYIYSKEKPAKCYQIGFDNAKGELINWSSDDVEYSEKALDIVYMDYKKFNHLKMIIAFNCIENGSPTSLGHNIMDKHSPKMAPIGVISRELLIALGGYDKNFYCGQSENDLVMRAYEIGCDFYLSSATAYIEHNKKHEGKSIFRSEDGFPYHKQDREYLESCWVRKDGTISETRLKKFEPF